MNYLLDTHALLCALLDDGRLSETASSLITDPDNSIFVSMISFWEIALKFNAGRISLQNVYPDELPKYSRKAGFEVLNPSPSEVSSIYRLGGLSHRDPFERLIVWQCIANNICMITGDSELSEYRKYGLQTVW